MSLVRTIVRYCTRVVLNRHESRRLARRIVRFLAKKQRSIHPRRPRITLSMLGPRRRGRNGGRVPFRSRLRAIQWRPHSSTESSAAHRVMVARNRTIRRASRRDSINRPAGFNRQAGGASGWDLLNDPFGKRAGCNPRSAAGSFDESVMTNQRRDCTRCEDWLAQISPACHLCGRSFGTALASS